MGLTMNVGIVGCGLIGKKRALTLGQHNLLLAVDCDIKRAETIAALNGQIKVSTDFNDIIKDPRIDIVIISTTNDMLAPISLLAVKAGKHVLVEKPAARNFKEIEDVIKIAKKNKVMVKVGFNLRYHPALRKAKEIIDSGKIGELMFMRACYGHGGRIGYNKEWRSNPKISGGGELIDQGVHLIDLSRWFFGDFVSVKGFSHTYFWDMSVDDNAFLSLRTKKQQVAWLHVSCTEWKNMFSLEIYGKAGKIKIDGLGGSYGIEKLIYYQMFPQMGLPETTVWEYPEEDKSWNLEFEAFVEAINTGRALDGDINDAYEALKIVDEIYAGSGGMR
ncbi:MAG: Gfo/Idh/MocA family oxidoreductase [Candidatus Omnitrophota bacterium]|nr:Gfo/Idh/MocA family oxidoreductase [Candidatus Omnitrophota bacterium]